MNQTFTELFRPETIVLVGASDNPASAGYVVTKNLLESDYEGEVFPVNPKYNTIYGKTCYRNLKHIPDTADLAVFLIAPERIPPQLEICGELGIKAILILSGGHRSADEQENELEKYFLHICNKYGMRMLGTESYGILTPDINLNLTHSTSPVKAGDIAFISQSYTISNMVVEHASSEHFGFSYFICAGTMCDIRYHELIDWLSSDFHTDCILIYMEALDNAREFMSAAREFTRRKPIVLFKAGKTLPSADVIYGNRGKLTGDHAVFSAAFRRVGIVEVNSLLQLFNSADAFGKQKQPKGNRLAIITNSAAPALAAVDKLIEGGGKLAAFTSTTNKKLEAIIPSQRRVTNPVDLYFRADIKDYQKAVLSCLYDDNTDAVLVIYSPYNLRDELTLAKVLVKIARTADKTVLIAWTSHKNDNDAKVILESGGLPVYHYPENAVTTFLRMHEYYKNWNLLYEEPSTLPVEFKRDKEKAASILHNALKENRTVLTEADTQRLLSCYGIPSPDNDVVYNVEDAVIVANKIGYPVVLKVSSSKIEHKTAIGGVQLNLNSDKEVITAYQTIKNKIKKQGIESQVEGILVEKMVKKAYELFVNAEKHPVFGPAIRFGMGGVAYDVLNDMAYGLPPLNRALAQRIIEETRIHKIIKGYKGMRSVPMQDIQDLLYRFSFVVMDFPQIKSLGINPFAIDEKGGIVLNARAVLDPNIDENKSPYHHLAILPYPEEYVQTISLKDNTDILLRPVRAEDEELERELMENLSDQSLYYRFFSEGIKITRLMLSRFTNIDYDREVTLVAEYTKEDTQHLAGIVHLVLSPDRKEGEYSIAIRDDWHGRGLGSRMTDCILNIAKTRNIKRIHATLLAENKPMLKLFIKKDFRYWNLDEETIAVEKFV